jgi:hypothetical protein
VNGITLVTPKVKSAGTLIAYPKAGINCLFLKADNIFLVSLDASSANITVDKPGILYAASDYNPDRLPTNGFPSIEIADSSLRY